MNERPLITLGFSSHRMEVLPYEQEEMWRHDAIVLEEAPEPGFIDVLSKRADLGAYLENQDMEFPEFSRMQFERLQELHQARKAIYQTELYLERIIEIHTLLAQGAPPQEVADQPHLRPVYETEKQADGLLLKFYLCSHTASFQRVVMAVKEFARADAARFRLRDELRAQALLPLIYLLPDICRSTLYAPISGQNLKKIVIREGAPQTGILDGLSIPTRCGGTSTPWPG